MKEKTLVGFLCFALAAVQSAPHAGARAGDESDISITLPQSSAVELREKLANAHAPSVLSVLGLEGAAEDRAEVPVPMRDGAHLSANLILPRAQAAQKLPVILIRTPYTPSSEVSEPLAPALLARAVRSGYAIVIVNDRGTQWSEGQYQWLGGRQPGRQRHPGLDHAATLVQRQSRNVRLLIERREPASARHHQSSGAQSHGGNGGRHGRR